MKARLRSSSSTTRILPDTRETPHKGRTIWFSRGGSDYLDVAAADIGSSCLRLHIGVLPWLHRTGFAPPILSRAVGSETEGLFEGVAVRVREALLRAAGLSMASATALGFARFAYSLLLPSMKSALHWNYLAAGAMNSANALGYLVGALVVTSIVDRLGARRTLQAAAIVITASLALTATSGTLGVLLALRLVSGAAGSVIFVVGTTIAQQLCHGLTKARTAGVLGVYFGGAGIGTAVSGVLVPAILSGVHGALGWRVGWLGLAAITAISMLIASRASQGVADPPPRSSGDRGFRAYRRLLPAIIAYGLFGFGYLSFLTFEVAYLASRGLPPSRVSLTYVVLGLGAAVGGFVWYRPLARFRASHAAAAIYFVAALATVMFLVSSSVAVEVVASVLFGTSLMTTSTAFGVLARRMVPVALQTGAMAVATVSIALGQALGPLVTGSIADLPNGLAIGVATSAAVIGLSVVVSLFQQEHAVTH
ncbi:MAG: YbfB/YjiJ family MFS transporter [Ferrimicrobium sp.]